MGRKARKTRPPHIGGNSLPKVTLPAPERYAAVALLSRNDWLVAIGLIVAVFLFYQPCWHGGLVWDDDAHVSRPELHSWPGLYRIWTDVTVTSQYYPLLHTAFCLEHALWGDAPIGYHLTNIALHGLAVVLALAVFRRLKLPGAYLAAAIFALHPVHVESVAWISEQKNTLSAVFYLGAMLLYLHFDQTRRLKWYLGAAFLFVAALLSKTVTGTLPGALLVIFWWQRGRLSWKNDVLPLAPLFLLGAGFGMLTAWWELTINRCAGPEFDFTLLQRLLIAGRTAWFCCGKLFWPARLTFVYPHWNIDSRAAWQYLFPLGAAALLALGWAVRRWSRGPLAAILFFGGTLFPVLGFFNLYTFRYSFVADHYQYLASLGIIALSSAAAALLLNRASGWRRVVGQVSCVALLVVLAILTWRQTRNYADAETLYNATIKGNPDCWLAHNNLGQLLAERDQVDAAMTCYRKALEIKPDYAEPHINIGLALADQGNVDGAIAEYQEALKIDGDSAEAHYNLGVVLAANGQLDAAITHYHKAIEIRPNYVEAHNNLGNALASRREFTEAIAEYEAALSANPDSAEAHNNLGAALVNCGRIDEAVSQFHMALEINPTYAEARNNLRAVSGRREGP